jgi:sec-independent protein translocase protein TatA
MEWGVVAIIAVAVVLAGSKLPQLARNVGRAQGEFKKGMREGTVDEPEPAPPAQATPPAPTAPPAAAPATPPAAEQPRPVEPPPAD